MNYYISDDILLDDWTEEFLLERLELPRVWKTLNNGFEIQELKPSRVDEVIKIIKVNYNQISKCTVVNNHIKHITFCISLCLKILRYLTGFIFKY